MEQIATQFMKHLVEMEIADGQLITMAHRQAGEHVSITTNICSPITKMEVIKLQAGTAAISVRYECGHQIEDFSDNFDQAMEAALKIIGFTGLYGLQPAGTLLDTTKIADGHYLFTFEPTKKD